MILVYIENTEATLSKASLVTISAALQAKSRHGYAKAVGLLVGEKGIDAAAKEAASYGLDEVVFVKGSGLDTYLALSYEDVFRKAIAELTPKLLVACATTRGKDLMPRIAYRLEAGQSSDTLEFVDGGLFKRPMFAGNILADVEVVTEKKVATIRATAFDPAEKIGAEAPVRELTLALAPTPGQEFVSFDTVESERPELTEAETVVSGGRAMKSSENFEKYLAPLADALGAAIGASRAAVDSGYAPNDWQVGQTGKVVAPKLYVAVGISGAIQHLAGMKDSKTIVAINTDPEAPIFEVADYGLVADLYEAVPALTEELKKRTS